MSIYLIKNETTEKMIDVDWEMQLEQDNSRLNIYRAMF